MKFERIMVRSHFICILSYLAAFFVSVIFWLIDLQLPFLILLLLTDIIGTLVIFMATMIFKNASLYDPYWSIAPLIIIYFYTFDSGIISLRGIFVLILVTIWSVRLTYNWWRQWKGISHEDWRYKELRSKTGKKFWLVNLVGIQIMPTLLVYLGSLSMFPIFYINNQDFSIFDVLAVIITIIAIIFEALADNQLRDFTKNRLSQEEIIKSGLWKYSRHPNYFGEILFWWGLYLFCLSTSPSYWWMIIGPLSITCLFLVVSIPLMEKRNMMNKPSYNSYRTEVSKLIPWFKKNKN